jgi:molecular chaperone DnaK
LISENADKITDDVKAPVEEAIAEVKTALEGTDDDAVKAAVEKLNTTSAALGQAMYAAAQANQSAPSEAGSPSDQAETNGSSGDGQGADEDVVDAEIVDEDQSSSGANR